MLRLTDRSCSGLWGLDKHCCLRIRFSRAGHLIWRFEYTHWRLNGLIVSQGKGNFPWETRMRCLYLGSVLLVLHVPGDKDIKTIDEILQLAMNLVRNPSAERANPLVYISICSSVGSVPVMSFTAFEIAVKLTTGGHNQFPHARPMSSY
ncbi:Magnesium transporter NIPA [Penicillium soppii]|uniref:Magnesium transporter NIPA n=1 Tax=Penicillium soppii TaxID=69789 RepID=UPI00254976C0|nr:Magnesium transporter NIPA [Penicillium soppii]KAJ5864821.1 Magnesium transporter NIPA [Penicillium soppii]